MKRIIFFFVVLTLLGLFLFPKLKQTEQEEHKGIKEMIYYENDIIGKIEISNETSYLVQTIDNEFYLHHNHKKQEDQLGATYLDYRNKLEDKKLLIYGHNSKELNPYFKLLENYLDEAYYKENPTINIKLQNIEYEYKIFSVMIVDKTEVKHTKINFTENEYKEQLKWLKENSIYNTKVEVNTSDYVVTLQTCNYTTEVESLLLVNLKREKKL